MQLAADFPPASRAQWLDRVAAGLKGRPVESLTSRTLDGLGIEPLYDRATDAPEINLAARTGAWTAMQRMDLLDSSAANRQALEDLENGASGLALVMRGGVTVGAGGLSIESADDLRRLLNGVELDLIAVRFDPGEGAREAAALLLDLYTSRGLDLSRCDLTLGLHPLSAMAERAALVEEVRVEAAMADVARRVMDKEFAGKAFLADTRLWHGAGATEVQELALALADAVAMLRWLERGGLDLAGAARLVGFLMTADADQFMTMAKLRALRLVWRRAEEAMGLDPKPATLHVETSWRMMSRRDPHVNLLRTAIAAFAAGVGGADSVTVLPFTAAVGLPDGFARRMARNIQSLLIEESGAGRVADPAAGSGYVEALTTELASRAWSLFQAIEAEGGLYAALRSGLVQRLIAEAAGKRAALVATRKLPLTGVSEFPDLDDGGCASPRTWAAGRRPSDGNIESLQQARLAEPFERLRDAADAQAVRPKVFLANLERLSDFGARATWTGNLLAAGGIAAIQGKGASSPAAAMEFSLSGAEVACVCSSDEVYAFLAVETARALREAGAKAVLIAGKPGALEEALNSAGVGAFLYGGLNVVEALERLQAELGIEDAKA